MRKLKIAVNAIGFCVVCGLMLLAAQFIVEEKLDEEANAYGRMRQFYTQEQDPDVVFVGSSQIFFNINPIQIFQEHGYTSYDFATSQNCGAAIELYVEEAIKKYSPALIVVEPGQFITPRVPETYTRIWLDPIPLSLRKIEMAARLEDIRAELGYDDIEYDSLISYAFPIMRYHYRWSELTKNDFFLDKDLPYYHGAIHYHGYGTHYEVTPFSNDHYFDSAGMSAAEERVMKGSFERVVEICRENNTELLLVRAPAPGKWRRDWHNLIAGWAEEYNLIFVDYNEKMDTLDLNLTTDFYDAGLHLNDDGVIKLTRAVGQYIAENYDLPDHRGDPDYAYWDEDWQVYQQDRASWYLANETDWSSYLQKLKDPNYTIYLAVRDTLAGDVHPELTGQLKTLGLMPELENAAQMGYVAILDGGNVLYEDLEDGPVAYEQQVGGHHISLVSEPYLQGNWASIELDWQEMFVDRRGVGIVVYDNVLDDVVDRVTFDLYEGGKAYR